MVIDPDALLFQARENPLEQQIEGQAYMQLNGWLNSM